MNSSRSAGPPRALAILAEVGGALLGGIVLAIALYYVVWLLFRGAGLGMGLLSLQVFGAAIGFGAGAGAGAALAGRLHGQHGNPWLAIAAGAVTGVVVILAVRYLFVRAGLLGILWIGAPLTLTAAVLAYNVRRR